MFKTVGGMDADVERIGAYLQRVMTIGVSFLSTREYARNDSRSDKAGFILKT